jgi:hypothetical protein
MVRVAVVCVLSRQSCNRLLPFAPVPEEAKVAEMMTEPSPETMSTFYIHARKPAEQSFNGVRQSRWKAVWEGFADLDQK